MQPEEIDDILILITKEFVQPQNFKRLMNEQVLANAIFYSFAVGALNNDENDYDTIDALKYVIEWIEDRENLLKGFRVEENDEK